MPSDAEVYVHRIGRTGRAGRKGHAVSLIAPSDRSKVKRFQQKLKVQFKETQPPSLKTINDARLESWKTQLISQTEELKNREEIDALCIELMNLGEIDTHELNAILISTLAKHKGIRFGIDSTHDPLVTKPKSSWKKEENEESHFASINETEVVLNIGNEMVHALQILFGPLQIMLVPGNHRRLKLIGKKTFVGLPNLCRSTAQH